MSGQKTARVTLSASERARLERERQNRANRRQAQRLGRMLREADQRLDMPFVRVRCAAPLATLKQHVAEVQALCERGEFTQVVEQAAALSAAIDAVEAGCWATPTPAAGGAGRQRDTAAQQVLTRVYSQWVALQHDEVIQKWMGTEVAALDKKLRPLQRYMDGQGAGRGGAPSGPALKLAEAAAPEIERLSADAETFEAHDLQRQRFIAGFQAALHDLQFQISEPYYEQPGNPHSRLRMTAWRDDGAEILLAFPLEEPRVDTEAGGFYEPACFAEYWRLIESLSAQGVEADFISADGPITPARGAVPLPSVITQQTGR